MASTTNLRISLLTLRLGVAIVMIAWTVDKFINPGHAKAVFGGFYGLANLSEGIFLFVGIAQALVILAFIIGIAKTWSRLGVLLMAAAGTLTPFAKYLDPWTGANLLFFAAWPMLAACIALYLMRDSDTMLSL